MTDGPPDSLIPYDEIVQDALRAVVGRVIGQVEKSGLPGSHHFYITFKTQAPGVDIPRHLTERYPDEMTIVIQNRYWDLHVSPTHFEVGLSFNQVGSKLVIPFAAITAFQDPAVDFALHFSAQADNQEPEEIHPPENDPVVRQVEDGSNVVSVDFTRKK
ncbi:ClpXP protease specificity-enhancing factor SspB [uncultured Sphingomonas sp.]|uniref:SspB family protein n=1 Tax=uncultured Sphingomonas sp. TaxID=158754 RepID=UPI0025DDC75A|nr:ClpXP protease specificity-enhancing factor SspB [uncultured Sphingomonas sp.]